MLFRAAILDRIAAGEVTLAFRRWRQPSVKAGGRLMTPAGVLAIDAVEPWSEERVTDPEARAAGHADRGALLRELSRREGELYRIVFHLAGEDPRPALRAEDRLAEAEVDAVAAALGRMDLRAEAAWTLGLLGLIGAREGVAAARLAEEQGLETRALKAKVRRLKDLGLTESLTRGYRLSPRGRAVLDMLTARRGAPPDDRSVRRSLRSSP